MNNYLLLRCSSHPKNVADIVCLYPKCAEQSRFYCQNCMNNQDHNSHSSYLIDIELILSSHNGKSLHPLKEKFLNSSLFQGQSPSLNKVQSFFDLLEKQILFELRRVKSQVISAAKIRQNALVNISQQIVQSESKIQTLLESINQNNLIINDSRDSFSIIEEINDNQAKIDLFDREIASFEGNKGENQVKNYIQNNNDNSKNFLDTSNDMNLSVEKFDSHILSLQISNELISLQKTACQTLIESDVEMHLLLSDSQLKINQFSEETETFIKNFLPENRLIIGNFINKNEKDILKDNFIQELVEQKLQIITPGEFFQKMGYRNCIAIDKLENIDLLKKVCSLLFHERIMNEREKNQLQSSHASKLNIQSLKDVSETNLSNSDEGLNKSIPTPTKQSHLPCCLRTVSAPVYFQKNYDIIENREEEIEKESSWQKDYFFSLFLNNKKLSDINLIQASKSISSLSFVSRLHLDFDANNISSLGYISLFQSIKSFNLIEHLDLRFNNNYMPDQAAIQEFLEILYSHNSSLKVLCLTMKSLLLPVIQQRRLSNSSSITSPLDTSSSSCSNNQLFNSSQWQQLIASQKDFYLNSSQPNINLFQSQNNILSNDFSLFHKSNFSNNFSPCDALRMIFEGVKNLSKLDVLYLDFSNNDLSQLSGQEVFSNLQELNKLKMVHLVFNKTKLPKDQVLDLMAALNTKKNPLSHCKLYFKENNYSFQNQRTISGQFQKVNAISKNFDLFF